MKLYFVRHGESTANLLREFSNNDNGHPLTETGLAQVRATAGRLIGLSIKRIFTSPVLRAVQTAQILSEELKASMEVSEVLREWSVGIYEGTTDPLGWELHRQVQEDWIFNYKLDSKMPGGESFIDIRERFFPFIEGLVKNGSGSNRNFVLVAHGGLFINMLPLVLQNLDHSFAHKHGFPYAGVVEAECLTE